MSHQYPGPQQPYQPYQGPAPYQPPPPPKKGMSAWAIVGITLGGIVAFFIIVGIAVGGTDTDKTTARKSTPAATPQKKAPSEAVKDAAQDPKPQEQPAKPNEYGEGDWVVGEDIPPGTYTTPGAKAGAFEFCSVTTKPTDDAKFPQIKSANANERIVITLTKADGVVTVQGCEPLTLRR